MLYDAAGAGNQLTTFRAEPLKLGPICCSETQLPTYATNTSREQRRPRYLAIVNLHYDFHTGIIFPFVWTACSLKHLHEQKQTEIERH